MKLEIKGLTKYYGKILGVKDLSLELKEGEIFGFIGPNGAGKSTTIRSVLNFIEKNAGKVFIDGEEFVKDNISLKEKIGYLPSEIHLYDDLTVKEMLDFHESFYKKKIHKRRCELVKRFQLNEKKKVEDLSLGNLKKLGIIIAFMSGAEIIILDEATSGLDPIMQQEFYKLLQEEKEKKTTILYSTHILSEVSKICDRVGIIKDGRLIKIDEVKNLIKDNLHLITLVSKDYKKIIKKINATVISEEGKTIKMKCNLESDQLLKILASFKIDKILIEEATLEDVVLQYYE